MSAMMIQYIIVSPVQECVCVLLVRYVDYDVAALVSATHKTSTMKWA